MQFLDSLFEYLHGIDVIAIAVYFIILVVLGIYLSKKASQSLEDYCIGNRSLPWWALGISGMASWLDVAGTMLIVSFLYMLGPRGLYIEFRGGAGLLLPFMLLFVGKWMRRSQCMTPAEWMIFRFGDGWGGRFAQLASAIGIVTTTIAMLAYMMKAIGVFLSMIIPLPPYQCTLILVGVATVYTMFSGFYGVVFTDIFQAFIILFAVIIISVMAATRVAAHHDFAEFALKVTGQANWMSSQMAYQIDVPRGYEQYHNLFMFAMFYLLNNIFRGLGFPGDPKYFGARNDRECGTLSFMWTAMMTFRWPLMIGFAVLGIYLVADLFPDQQIVADASAAIRQAMPDITAARWEGLVSDIRNRPGDFPDLVPQLQGMLGESWEKKILLVGFNGTVNPERILPAVLLFRIPAGLRGLMLIALIAASMSTFDTNVNLAAGVMTRDIYQKHIRPEAKNRELIMMTWLFVLIMVGIAFGFAYSLKNVNEIWGWIVMGLGAGALVPGFLRLYWWRFNGQGFAIGTIVGMLTAVVHRVVVMIVDKQPGMEKLYSLLTHEVFMFCEILIIGFIATVIGTLLTKPENPEIVRKFYIRTRPFGLWGPFEKSLPPHIREKVRKEHFYDIAAIPFVFLWQISMFMLPMQLIIQSWRAFWITLAVFLVGLGGMYFLWYRKLPKGKQDEEWVEELVKNGTLDESLTLPGVGKE